MISRKFGAVVGGACLVGCGVLIGVTAQSVIADEHANGAEADMMAKWMEYMTPGPQHAEMATYAGKWDMTSKMWMDPNAPPQEMNGACTWEMVMGGRYMVEKVDSPPMMPGAERFAGMNIVGYDNFTKRYFYAWIDNMGTGIMVGYGESADGGKTVEYLAEAPDPMTGQMTKSKSIIRHVSHDKVEFEMYAPSPDGGWWKNFEGIYTRAK